jgi:hypothetical protein
VRVRKLRHKTLEGRNVFGIEISAGVRRADGRPTFYVDGVHHAREWPAAEYPMIFVHYLAERFGRNRQVTSLLKRLRVVIVPVVNVDGFDYSRESLADGQGLETYPLSGRGPGGLLEKESLVCIRRDGAGCTQEPGCVRSRSQPQLLLRLRRRWGRLLRDSRRPDQRGDAPFSDPETRNIRKLVLSRHVTGVITNHTYGDLVLRPWGHTAKDSPDERILALLGARLARAMGGYANERGSGSTRRRELPTTGRTPRRQRSVTRSSTGRPSILPMPRASVRTSKECCART